MDEVFARDSLKPEDVEISGYAEAEGLTRHHPDGGEIEASSHTD